MVRYVRQRNFKHRKQLQIIDCHLYFNASPIGDSGLNDKRYHLTREITFAYNLIHKSTSKANFESLSLPGIGRSNVSTIHYTEK